MINLFNIIPNSKKWKLKSQSENTCINIETDIAPIGFKWKKIGSYAQKINNNTAYNISNKLNIVEQKLLEEYP